MLPSPKQGPLGTDFHSPSHIEKQLFFMSNDSLPSQLHCNAQSHNLLMSLSHNNVNTRTDVCISNGCTTSQILQLHVKNNFHLTLKMTESVWLVLFACDVFLHWWCNMHVAFAVANKDQVPDKCLPKRQSFIVMSFVWVKLFHSLSCDS